MWAIYLIMYNFFVSVKRKKSPHVVPFGFRFKFREAYIHIRSKLNPSCDSVRLIEVMKACIYIHG